MEGRRRLAVTGGTTPADPCVNGELWPTAIASSDAEFAAQSGAALAVLESVNFTP